MIQVLPKIFAFNGINEELGYLGRQRTPSELVQSQPKAIYGLDPASLLY